MQLHIRQSKSGARSRGAVLVLFAILLTVFMGFGALAIDVGVIATARAQLKTVADSAALAGARELANPNRISTTYVIAPDIINARLKAKEFGELNYVLNEKAQLRDIDIVIGYKKVTPPNQDPPDKPVDTTTAPPLDYNSVQVTATHSSPALFSRVFGSTGSTISVTSTATVQVFEFGGYRISNGEKAGILPIVMAQSTYKDMTGNATGDSYTFTSSTYNPPSTNGVTSGPDGISESVAYPVDAGLAGNFGTVNFGVSANSTNVLGSQISDGVTPTQLENEFPGGDFAVPHMIKGDPGLSAGIKDNLIDIIGKPVTVPIYDDTIGSNGLSGNGNNSKYKIIGFASVRIVAVNFQGNNKYVIVQPALSEDPAAIPNPGKPVSWTDGGLIFLHLSR